MRRKFTVEVEWFSGLEQAFQMDGTAIGGLAIASGSKCPQIG
ncbi:hypothetical protein QEH59_14570 [Coraliomargarita sp. SDUM461004]|uniref:Uncharacterized protein n=1 Tax=Thalassobacterium sedimentorum TaxID=3041258 RepID=A0ABU1AP73_9BACT|nr:hypothetical protein [Coraliomargarita sp. SDUM461004]